MTVSLIPGVVAQFVGISQAPFYLGIISSITDAFASFLRLFSGFLSDRLSNKKTLIAIGYGMSALFSSLVGFAHSIWGVLLYRTYHLQEVACESLRVTPSLQQPSTHTIMDVHLVCAVRWIL